MRLRWTLRAVRDLEQIDAFLAEEGDAAAAAALIRRVVDAIQVVASFPDAGRAGRVSGTRELVVTGTPFVVPYRVRRDVVEVLRVLHGSRRWPNHL